MLLTNREGIVMSKASPQTKSSLSPMDRNPFRIVTRNGKRGSWFKRTPKTSTLMPTLRDRCRLTKTYHKDLCSAKYIKAEYASTIPTPGCSPSSTAASSWSTIARTTWCHQIRGGNKVLESWTERGEPVPGNRLALFGGAAPSALRSTRQH